VFRIAFTSLYLPGGSKIGVGYQVHHLANELTRRGHTVAVFSPDGPGEDHLYDFHRVDSEPPPRTFRFALRIRGLDLAGYDVLHAHDGDYFLAAKSTPPHVRTLYGSCFSEAIHIPGTREKIRMLLLGVSEVASTGIADRTVAISAATARVYPWVKTIIPCGVDTQRFDGSGSNAKRSESPTILFVGTYKNRKRGRLLAEVFTSEILPKLPDARLCMVCSDAPPAPGIDVLGRVSDAELVELYQTSSVFCLPSTYEGFGVPYIEALAAGCPVVATPNPGANEVLDHGRFGVITPAEHLGATLLELLGDTKRRDDMAARGLVRAQRYDWSRVVDAYEAVYASLVHTR
jgi:phosphatidyl-myo-inositol alpha-mannosyltransferase